MGKRHYKQGINREQGYQLPPRVEEYVGEDNPVRAIDSYVESLDVEQMQFVNAGGELKPGQPAYPPRSLLKLYLYGYLHRLRSSRQLEAECGRNLEVIWLLQGLQPSYKTIADFRKNNLKALKQVNQDFVQLCKELDLFGAELVGIDGSFFRGNVAKSRIFTAEQLQRSLERIEKHIGDYLEELNQVDEEEEQQVGQAGDLQAKLKQLRERQAKRTEQVRRLQASGEKQIAEVDEDARLLRKGGQSVAGYHVQIAVDEKYKLIVAGEVTQDGNDSQQAVPMGIAAKRVLGVDTLETVQDSGYFNGLQIQACLANGITPYIPEPAKQNEKADPARFPRRDFQYDPHTNCYTCPNGKAMPHKTSFQKDGRLIWAYQASPHDCADCPFQAQCLSAKTAFRTVTRWEHEAIFEAHRERMNKEGAGKMRKRAEICEHPFGTLKLGCGWTHFLLRGLEKVRAEWSLMMLGYNFRRVLAIFGLAAFRAYCNLRNLPHMTVSS
jgi:transposase